MLPRERLIEYGPESLAISDLLAIIIGSGSKKQNVFDIADKLVNQTDLYDLLELSYEELMKIEGIKSAKACKIIAAIELSKRIFNYKRAEGNQFKDADSIYRYLKSYYLGKKKEEFLVLYFDSSLRLIRKRLIRVGDEVSVYADFAEVFKYAFKYDSPYMVLAHNHPSNDFHPSSEDKLLTNRIAKQAKAFDIVLLDHIIITDNQYFSFSANNLIE